jgi:peroxiredoxin Q/BCP
MSSKIQDGDKAPEFNLKTDGDGDVSLAAMSGRPFILYFYPKDDTSGCTKQAIAFTEKLDEFEALGATVVGVSPDGVAKHDKFKAKHDLAVTLAADEDKATCDAYGVWVEKSMYGRKYMGVERSTFLIDADGQVANAWRKVKVPGHVDMVLEATKSLIGA